MLYIQIIYLFKRDCSCYFTVFILSILLILTILILTSILACIRGSFIFYHHL